MGRAVLCLGNVSVPEMADRAGAGCKAHSPAEGPAAQLGQPPARAGTCRMTLGTGTSELLAPRAVAERLAFPGLDEMPLLLSAREQDRNQAVHGAVFGFLPL